MRWFRTRQETHDDNVDKQHLLDVDTESKVEVVAHKKATKKTIDETIKVNQQLNKLLVENGFTLKIYLAAGGKHPQAKQSGSGAK